jgi:hypothetical protein
VTRSQNDIQCGICGRLHPRDRLRARGYATCTCGVRIEVHKGSGAKGGFPGLAVIGLVIAAAISGAAYLWARGLG